MQDTQALDDVFKTSAILTRKELLESGLSRRQIEGFLASGAVERVAKNLYTLPSLAIHPYFENALSCKMTGGIVWLGSAGRFHELTDELPRSISILAPATSHSSSIPLSVSIRRTRNEKLLAVGIETITADGFSFPVTNKARTVVDLYRLGGIRQHAIESVRAYLADGNSTEDLQKMAAEFGVETQFNDMIAVTLCAFDRMSL